MLETILKSVPVLGASLSSCGGALLFNEFVKTNQASALCAGLALYMLANGFWISVLRTEGLGYAVVVCSLLTTIFLVVIDPYLSGSRLSAVHVAGLSFAVLAIVLFSLPKLGVR